MLQNRVDPLGNIIKIKARGAWMGNPEYSFHQKISIQLIDAILQQERIDDDKSKKTFEQDNKNLPNGTFVVINGKPYLLHYGSAFLWSPFGYKERINIPHEHRLTVLTPRSIVNTFRAGYVPQISPSISNIP